LIMDCNTKSL